MKKLYNTPELNVNKLYELDIMTASGEVMDETAVDNVNDNYSLFDF